VHAVVGTAPIDVYLKTLRRKQLEEYHAAFEGEGSLLYNLCLPLDLHSPYISSSTPPFSPPPSHSSSTPPFSPPLSLIPSSSSSHPPSLSTSVAAAKAGGHSMPPRSQSDANIPSKGQGQGGVNSSKYNLRCLSRTGTMSASDYFLLKFCQC
jgi:hypothetical protein